MYSCAQGACVVYLGELWVRSGGGVEGFVPPGFANTHHCWCKATSYETNLNCTSPAGECMIAIPNNILYCARSAAKEFDTKETVHTCNSPMLLLQHPSTHTTTNRHE